MALFKKTPEALKTRAGSTHSVAKPRLSSLNRTITWPLIPALTLLFPVAVASQPFNPILTYPTVSGLTEPKFNATESINFGDAQSTCPVATINVSGYSGSNQNWALFNNNVSTARSGLGDSGIAAGIRIPLANELMKQCRENAKAFVKRNNLKMNSELILFCASIRDVDVDVTDNDFKLAFPDFHRCKSVKVIAKAPDTSQNPRREGGPERGIIPEPTRGRFNLKDLPRVDFNFGPPRKPLLETFTIRNR
jgi:hypothetical protein